MCGWVGGEKAGRVRVVATHEALLAYWKGTRRMVTTTTKKKKKKKKRPCTHGTKQLEGQAAMLSLKSAPHA